MTARTDENDTVGLRVSRNVRSRRAELGWTLDELSLRCAAIGWPLSAAALLRIEQHKRGVEAGDLVALAECLQVSVISLLYPTTEEKQHEMITAVGSLPVSPIDYVGILEGRKFVRDRDRAAVMNTLTYHTVMGSEATVSDDLEEPQRSQAEIDEWDLMHPDVQHLPEALRNLINLAVREEMERLNTAAYEAVLAERERSEEQ